MGLYNFEQSSTSLMACNGHFFCFQTKTLKYEIFNLGLHFALEPFCKEMGPDLTQS